MTPMAPELEGLVSWLEDQYDRVRVLPDGSIAVCWNLITTRAIALDVTREGWGARFCFSDPRVADDRFDALQSAEDVPAGHVARR